MIAYLRSEELNNQYRGLVGIRKIIALKMSQIQLAIDSGLVYDFIKILDHQLPEFQYEALWNLTNIASGTSDQVNSIVSKGGLIKIVKLIDSKVNEVQEQVVFLARQFGQ